MRTRRPRTLVRAAMAAVLLAATPATAEVYDTGDPYDGQTIDHSPAYVLIRFTEPVQMKQASLEFTDGRSVTLPFGLPEDDEALDSVSVRMPEVLGPGVYLVRWVAYVPGHRHDDDGTVTFTVAAPATAGQAAAGQAAANPATK